MLTLIYLFYFTPLKIEDQPFNEVTLANQFYIYYNNYAPKTGKRFVSRRMNTYTRTSRINGGDFMENTRDEFSLRCWIRFSRLLE